MLSMFIGLFNVLLGRSVAEDHQWSTTSPLIIDLNRVRFPEGSPDQCFLTELDGYLKEVCKVKGEVWVKCEYSDTLYQMSGLGDYMMYTALCPNDRIFYQACPGTSRYIGSRKDLRPDLVACKSYTCDFTFVPTVPHLNPIHGLQRAWIDCDVRENVCDNTDILDQVCGWNWDPDQMTVEMLCDNGYHTPPHSLCDGFCDCEDCRDESRCNGVTYGIFCRRRIFIAPNEDSGSDEGDTYVNTFYVPPWFICDNNPNCYGGEDEHGCYSTVDSDWCNHPLFYNATLKQTTGKTLRVLKNYTRCSLASVKGGSYANGEPFIKVCEDRRDQTNCTDDSIAPLLCRVDGYLTTIAKYAICQDWGLCDDGFESLCLDVSPTCRIHRHELCDGVQNCDGGEDEFMSYCHVNILDNFTCTRALSPSKTSNTTLPFLAQWIRDGVQDCRSGLDEVPGRWFKECGTGSYLSYTQDEPTAHCGDQDTMMQCGRGIASTLVKLKYLCNEKEHCSRDICLESRSQYQDFQVRPLYSDVLLANVLHCLPGLRTMEELVGRCVPRLFHGHAVVFGTKPITLRIPERNPSYLKSCTHVFGEIYVFLHCNGICSDPVCPLSRVDKYSCPNVQDRALSVAENTFLTVVQATKNFSVQDYHSHFFRCGNSKCLEYDKVCNLVDDCGDASDESNCTNNFRCEYGGFIPLVTKCDGNINCFDYSDECNEDCDIQIKSFPHLSLSIVAILVGVAILILNLGAIANSIRELLKSKSEKATVNRFFILIISAGDLLMGVYLLTAVLADWLANSSTCRTQFEWTSSTTCSVIGVISTWGSNMSLLAMTVLGLIRATGLVNPSIVARQEVTRRKIKIRLGVASFLICAVPLVFTLLPLVSFQDYFVEERSFGVNPLFAGAPDKQKLHDILRRYYRVPIKDLSWKNLQTLTSSMFQNEVSDVTMGKPISFYGSTGFCLFKYFIRPGNSQKTFSLALIVFNGACVLTMTICYILIQISAVKSSKKAAGRRKHCKARGGMTPGNEHQAGSTEGRGGAKAAGQRRNKKLLIKVLYLIVTNIVTWIPFLCFCIVHYYNLSDLSQWYGIISIIELPLNAVINPIGLYDEFSGKLIKKLKWVFGR